MPLTLTERIDVLAKLGESFKPENEKLAACVQRSFVHNPWFTPDNSWQAIEAIRASFLQKDQLQNWVANYPVADVPTPLRIGLVVAGNIPLVGFHDLLSVFISGYVSVIKLSQKDQFFIPFLINELIALDHRVKAYFEIVERLTDFDAVIATGSNNTARYFEQYFGSYPHIIRRNRNGVAVLNGDETGDELQKLGKDIFQYFGLGCRNVSKLYVPKGYDFTAFLEATHHFKEIILHNKYKNNFDYNYTLYILNKIPHLSNGCLLLVEDEAIQSRIASLHYEYYEQENELLQKLERDFSDIQCIIAMQSVGELATKPIGAAQQPTLDDYADGVDTLHFLTQLNKIKAVDSGQ